jgi:hypothetical protein
MAHQWRTPDHDREPHHSRDAYPNDDECVGARSPCHPELDDPGWLTACREKS